MKPHYFYVKLCSTLAVVVLFVASWFTFATIADVSANQSAASSDATSPSAVVWPNLQFSEIEGGLAQPVHVTHAGDGSNRLFVVEKGGIIKILKNGNALPTPFLNITERVNSSCNECGLLSVAFPPDFVSKGYFFVYYNAKGNPVDLPPENPEPDPSDGNDSIIARFSVTSNQDIADPASETQIMLVNQPYSNHNGGQLAFGKDGYLYLGLGDGGSGNDPLGAGQRRDTLLGKILRIAVSNTGTYTIPNDNPFISDTSAKKEIWSYGWRNPWRFSFDRQTGDMYIGDVGQNAFEEVDFEAAGAGGLNYGWNTMEGKSCFNATSCNQTGLILPFFDYPREKGRSVTGGVIYRGALYPRMQGIYFWGDFATGQTWGAQRENGNWVVQELKDTGYGISSFGEDEAGNIYLADYSGGKLYQLTDMTAPPTVTVPPPTTPANLKNKVFMPIVRKS